MRTNYLPVLIILLFLPSSAFAYVDPGIVGALWQWFYVLIVGAISAWVIRPWAYVKSFLTKKKTAEISENNENENTD
jgi:hypothetical protein